MAEKYNEFDTYLSSRLARANSGKLKNYFDEFEFNYARFLPENKSARILDLGCGMGQFVMFLREKKYANVTGAELSQEAVDYCREKAIENVLKIDEPDKFLSANAGKFDFIVLKSVIAHLDPDKLILNLRLIREALKEGGEIFIETFNASILTGPQAKFDDFTHKSAFTEESLYQVLFDAGFKNINIYGNSYRIKGIKSFFWVVLKKLWQLMLRTIYVLERGTGDNPKILTKLLIATAKK